MEHYRGLDQGPAGNLSAYWKNLSIDAEVYGRDTFPGVRRTSEGHACRARWGAMGNQSVFIGPDRRVPPICGPDKQVPPKRSEGHACRAR